MKKRSSYSFAKNKRGQVWVETVIYTLIAFVVLGGVLAFAKPKIEELQDESTIEESVNMLEQIDQTINEISPTTGNRRKVTLSINKGNFQINSPQDKITFNMETSYQYSEPGQTIEQGPVKIKNNQVGETYRLNATLEYEDYNITWSGQEETELLTSSPTEYQIFVTNEGQNPSSQKKTINFETV